VRLFKVGAVILTNLNNILNLIAIVIVVFSFHTGRPTWKNVVGCNDRIRSNRRELE